MVSLQRMLLFVFDEFLRQIRAKTHSLTPNKNPTITLRNWAREKMILLLVLLLLLSSIEHVSFQDESRVVHTNVHTQK